MKRKRAPGAGRKPTGPFAQNAAQLTIRMPTDMRKQLAVSAARRQNGAGWSLSQELLYRLQHSFDRERDERRDPANRALSYILAEIISFVAGAAGAPYSEWRSDPFAFRTIKLAFALVLDALEPKGKIRAPRTKDQPILGDTFIRGSHFEIPGNTPEEMARSVRDVILFELARESNEPLAPDKTRTQQAELAMLQAARALLLKKGEQP
jgi:hypothetical protein